MRTTLALLICVILSIGSLRTVQAQAPSLELFDPSINGMAVTLNGVTLPGAQGRTVTSIAWDWGDGTAESHHWFPNTHTYRQSGTYTITVTSFQNDGQWTKRSVSANVGQVTSQPPLPSPPSQPTPAFSVLAVLLVAVVVILVLAVVVRRHRSLPTSDRSVGEASDTSPQAMPQTRDVSQTAQEVVRQTTQPLQTVFCTSCGKQLPAQATYCFYCGTKQAQ